MAVSPARSSSAGGDFVGQWVTYMVRCSDGTLYTGVTNDLEKRVKTHNTGKGAKYIRSRLPVTLVYMETHSDRSTAQRAEAELKGLKRMQKLKKVESVARSYIGSGAATLIFSDKERQGLEGFLERHGNCVDSTLTIVTSHDSGIGLSTQVTCQCGGSQDITDYGIW